MKEHLTPIAGSSVTTFTKITYNDGTNEDETPGTSETYSALTLGGSSNTLTIPITAIKSLGNKWIKFKR